MECAFRGVHKIVFGGKKENLDSVILQSIKHYVPIVVYAKIHARYLGKEYESLVTMDTVCHGVGSQVYFDKYMEYAENHYGEIKEFQFRSKEHAGWFCGAVAIKNHKNIKKFDSYNNNYYYYLRGHIYRKSCYEYSYANIIRQGDFSVGDFWGVEAWDLGIDSKTVVHFCL